MRVDLPVERGEIVARQVLAVLGELDAEPFEGTAMQAGEKSFDDRARLEIERAEPGDDRRVEKARCARPRPLLTLQAAAPAPARPRAAARSMRSAVMPSASA